MRHLWGLKRQPVSVARRGYPVVAVVAMESVIGSEGHCVNASGVHGWISKRHIVNCWSLSI
jgi:hypothetical protein